MHYAADRKQFGKPINQFQAIQTHLAEMGTDLEAATHLVHYAAWRKDAGLSHQREAAMAKLFATERAVSICDKATRVLGSYGFAMEFAAQRYFRDIRFTLYGGGTSEILKLLISREMMQECRMSNDK
jgi:butyryl-CoA dehydrogenase